VGWLFTNFLSQSPFAYLPLDRQMRYWYPLALPACFLAIAVSTSMTPGLLRRLYLSLLFVPLPLLLATAGPWGQNVEVSRELLAHSLMHPELQFATDVYTYEEMMVLGDGLPPENLVVFGRSAGSFSRGFVRTYSMTLEERGVNSGDSLHLLINELNLPREKARELDLTISPLTAIEISEPTPRLLVRPLGLGFIDRVVPDQIGFWTRKPAAKVAALHVSGAEVVTAVTSVVEPPFETSRVED